MKHLFICIIILSTFLLAEAKSLSNYHELQYYNAKGVESNLLQIPGEILTLQVPFEETYLNAVGYYLPFHISEFNTGSKLLYGVNFIAVKHNGIQDNYEVDAAILLKYTELFPKNSYINVNLGVGDGASYALDTPMYEKPVPSKDNPEGRYRLQNFIVFDIEFYNPAMEYLNFFRLHHRSGIYGLVAPPEVGSNFLGFGIKYRLN